MRATIPFTAISLAVVASLVVATPAAAATFTSSDVTAGGTTWSVSGFSTGSQPNLEEADRADWFGNDDTFDSGLEPVYLATGITDLNDTSSMQCASDGDLSVATDGTGDQIATCELEPFETGDGTLNATYELRFFSDGATVRARLIVTNDGVATVSGAHVGFDDNYYQDSDTYLGASTTEGHPASGDAVVVDGDRLWVIYDAFEEDEYEVPVVLTAAGTADAEISPVIAEAAGNGDDDQVTLYPLPDLAPSQTVEVAQFWVWNFFEFDVLVDQVSASVGSDERTTVEVVTEEGLMKTAFVEPSAAFVPAALAAVEESWDARVRFNSLSTRDAAGITDLDRVLNWVPTAEEEEAELADTGADDVLPLAAFAALLLLAGAGVVAVRRRMVTA